MPHPEPRYLQLELLLAYVASAMRGSARLLSIKQAPEFIVAAATEFMPWTDSGEAIIFESELPCLSIWEREANRENRGIRGESVDVKLMYVDRFDVGGLDTPARTWGRRWAKETRWVAFEAIDAGEFTLSDGSTVTLCPAGEADIIEEVSWRKASTFCETRGSSESAATEFGNVRSPNTGGDGICGWEADLTLVHAHPPFPLADPPALLQILFALHPEALSPDNEGPIVSAQLDDIEV